MKTLYQCRRCGKEVWKYKSQVNGNVYCSLACLLVYDDYTDFLRYKRLTGKKFNKRGVVNKHYS